MPEQPAPEYKSSYINKYSHKLPMTLFNPVSTYRLQFNKDFTFKDAETIVPYLYKSGIKTIYASPVLQAVKGSAHGYDVTNPLKLNPEIGTDEDFESLIKKLHDYQMGWIQDIVPNHMAYSVENPWIYDILEKGNESEYYEYFDIYKNHPDANLTNKLMLPFFGKPLDQLINDFELSVSFGKDGFKLHYFENEYPVSVPAYSILLKFGSDNKIPASVEPFFEIEQYNNFDRKKEKLFAAYSDSAETKAYINECLKEVNKSSGKMKAVTDALLYYPAYWRETETKINYRRFFTINSLICLNIQHKKVFEACHKIITGWINQKLIDGIRIDHIDGLFNPSEYLKQLRELTGPDFYISVEKILEKDEYIPGQWPVQGSTGYDFLGLINNLLTHREKGPLFYSFYNDWIQKPENFEDVFYSKNRYMFLGWLIYIIFRYRIF